LSIDVSRDGAVATVTLNRPEKLNALDLEHVVALRDALRGLAGEDDVRAVVLTGAGRGFCAGGDVTSMTGEGGAIGAHAAVANAVLDALRPLGVKSTKTPLGPEQIFALVEAASA
jgi:2-(1,2-epoxy-1,2-dihydrophenyl)acetyl-CoA isomerase